MTSRIRGFEEALNRICREYGIELLAADPDFTSALVEFRTTDDPPPMVVRYLDGLFEVVRWEDVIAEHHNRRLHQATLECTVVSAMHDITLIEMCSSRSRDWMNILEECWRRGWQ